MVQWVYVLATKPEILGLNPGTHTVEGKEPEKMTCLQIFWSQDFFTLNSY